MSHTRAASAETPEFLAETAGLLADYLRDHGITQLEFSRRVGVSPGMVWQWLNLRRPVSAARVIPIERATGGKLSRHQLRPDLYPRDRVA